MSENPDVDIRELKRLLSTLYVVSRSDHATYVIPRELVRAALCVEVWDGGVARHLAGEFCLRHGRAPRPGSVAAAIESVSGRSFARAGTGGAS